MELINNLKQSFPTYKIVGYKAEASSHGKQFVFVRDADRTARTVRTLGTLRRI